MWNLTVHFLIFSWFRRIFWGILSSFEPSYWLMDFRLFAQIWVYRRYLTSVVISFVYPLQCDVTPALKAAPWAPPLSFLCVIWCFGAVSGEIGNNATLGCFWQGSDPESLFLYLGCLWSQMSWPNSSFETWRHLKEWSEFPCHAHPAQLRSDLFPLLRTFYRDHLNF